VKTPRTFTIPVSNGLLCASHREKIGAAIWVFLWLIDHTTKEVPAADGKVEGLVHGGQPVALSAIASDLGMSWDAIYEHLAQLAKAGYVRKIVHGIGRANGYAVVNSKRFSNRRTKADRSEPETSVQNPAGTPVQNATGTPVQIPIDLPAFVRGPTDKSPSVYKERLLQDLSRHKSNDDDPHFTPDMIAQAVCDDLGLSGADLMRTIGDVAKYELKHGKTADEVRGAMTEAWREHSAALADGKLDPAYSPGPDTFFGKAKWRNKATWNWREGHKPRPEKSRRYANGASA
jgi:DNA-binding transcriptional ArsR family regulator